METKPTKQKKFRKDVKNTNIYIKSLITRTISLPISTIGKNIRETIEKCISAMFEGKCLVEGFVKPGSSTIITHSSGMVSGTNVKFEVVFECYICCPVEGMLIECVAKNITNAGIRAESATEKVSPVVVFVTRDHHYMNPNFSKIQENDTFVARVIGQRYELNDKYVSIIAELVDKKEFDEKNEKTKKPKKPTLVIDEDDE